MLEISIRPQTTANSETHTVTAATSHSSKFTAPTTGLTSSAVVTVDTDTYMRCTSGATTVVAADGTDQLLLANNQYRVNPIPDGFYLHFIRKSADGNVFITPLG